LGAAAGLLAWEPKWPHVIPLWALNNLLLVCVAEEAFFRGYVQQGLTTLLGQRRYATWLGLGVAALLFGLAHFAAGPAMMAIAAVAGLGYGMAYQRGGLLAAILAHFALNALHLILFTYPMMR
jgi:membrane protease YdiL (CAAX protease family)